MNQPAPNDSPATLADEDEISLLDLLLVISENLKLLIFGPLVVGLLALGYSFTMTPVFTAKTTIIPPTTQGSGGAAAALLGQFGGLVGGALPASGKHMAYLDSDMLRDEIIQKYDLQKKWEKEFLVQAREQLKGATQVSEDKKTGVISISYTDEDPKFAAQVANDMVAILSRLMGEAALADARERREFLEKQIAEATKKTYQSPSVRDAIIQNLIRQFETTRIEEQQPNPSITQVDIAKPPELKSGPKKALIAVITTLATGFLLLLYVFVRQALRNADQDPESAGKLARIRGALSFRKAKTPNVDGQYLGN